MMKNVFLIGAMKCGTNTLYHALRSHPAAAAPEKKELDYFIKPSHSQPYSAYFPITCDTEFTLDGTTQYSKYPHFPHMVEAIHQMNRDARIIYLARDPVDRFESNIAHHIARAEDVTLRTWRKSKKYQAALDYGRYYTQIGPYANRFGRKRVFVGTFEDFVANQTDFINRICEFIGIYAAQVRVPRERRNARRDGHGAEQFMLSQDDETLVAKALQSDIDCLGYAFDLDVCTPWMRYQKALHNV